MELSKIEVIGDKDNPTRAEVFIDGNPIKGISRISYEHSAGDIPEITFDISGYEIDMHAFNTIIETHRAKVLIRRG